MIRETKYRFWNGQQNEMEYDRIYYPWDAEEITVGSFFNTEDEHPESRWLEYVGRGDDYGEKIYEGDWIEVSNIFSPHEFTPKVFTVEYYPKVAAFVLVGPSPSEGTNFFNLKGCKIKVVGNKWEGLK